MPIHHLFLPFALEFRLSTTATSHDAVSEADRCPHLGGATLQDRAESELAVSTGGMVRVLTPLLPRGLKPEAVASAQRQLLDSYLREHAIERFVAWYYTPMA